MIFRIIHRSKGQGMLEYILISGLIGLFCLMATKQFGKILEKRIQVLKTKVVEQFKV